MIVNPSGTSLRWPIIHVRSESATGLVPPNDCHVAAADHVGNIMLDVIQHLEEFHEGTTQGDDDHPANPVCSDWI